MKQQGLTIKQILLDAPLPATRLWLVFGAWIWAIMLLHHAYVLPEYVHFPALCKEDCSKTYGVEFLTNAWIWAFAFMFQGVMAFFSLRTGVRNKTTMMLDALLGCVLWSGSTLVCLAMYWPSQYQPWVVQFFHWAPPVGMSGTVVMTIASWWSMIRYWAGDCNPTICVISEEDKEWLNRHK